MKNKYGIEEWNTKPENKSHYEYKSPIELLLHDLEYITNHLINAYKNNDYIDNKFWGNYLHNIALAIYNKNENENKNKNKNEMTKTEKKIIFKALIAILKSTTTIRLLYSRNCRRKYKIY